MRGTAPGAHVAVIPATARSGTLLNENWTELPWVLLAFRKVAHLFRGTFSLWLVGPSEFETLNSCLGFDHNLCSQPLLSPTRTSTPTPTPIL